ncbi:MAG TPA: oligopeptide/dipeptide ABC transporter ATP-binding protein [Paenirhodobacter sp.]
MIETVNLSVNFTLGAGLFRPVKVLHAVEGVSLRIQPGETLGLVGESGCGKSTLGRAIVGLQDTTAGDILLDGQNIGNIAAKGRAAARRKVQMIFQDPLASLNPRMTIGQTIEEPIRIHALRDGAHARRDRVNDLMEMVELPAAWRNRYPHELSGGQRQRIGIARALACEPRLIVCDEPVSALDVSIQAQMMRLFRRLQEELGLSYLFIAHGLGVIRKISDRVAVMYLGRIVETGSRDEVFGQPRHPYTRALISAAPVPDPMLERERRRIVLTGDLPSPFDRPAGCAFAPRCPMVSPDCRATNFHSLAAAYDHTAACLLNDEDGVIAATGVA